MNNLIKLDEHKFHKFTITVDGIICLTCNKKIVDLHENVNSLKIKEILDFQDLPEDCKKFAIEKIQEYYDQLDFEVITEYAIEYMDNSKINDIDINWSLNYSQSDYVAITGNIYLEDLISVIEEQLTSKQLKNIKNIAKIENVKFDIQNTYRHNLLTSYDSFKHDRINKLLEVIDNCLLGYMNKITKELKNYIQNQIDYMYSDEYAIETIEINNYKFYLNGEIA